MKTKHFKNFCPHTNSEMEISVLYQETLMTGTLTRHFKKVDFTCPKFSECPYGKKDCPLFGLAQTSFQFCTAPDLFGAFEFVFFKS